MAVSFPEAYVASPLPLPPPHPGSAPSRSAREMANILTAYPEPAGLSKAASFFTGDLGNRYEATNVVHYEAVQLLIHGVYAALFRLPGEWANMDLETFVGWGRGPARTCIVVRRAPDENGRIPQIPESKREELREAIATRLPADHAALLRQVQFSVNDSPRILGIFRQ